MPVVIDVDKTQEEANDITNKNIRGNTREGYVNCLVHLFEWLQYYAE